MCWILGSLVFDPLCKRVQFCSTDPLIRHQNKNPTVDADAGMWRRSLYATAAAAAAAESRAFSGGSHRAACLSHRQVTILSRLCSSLVSAADRRSDVTATVAELFAHPNSVSDPQLEFDLDPVTVSSVVTDLETSPDAAFRFFNWVSSKEKVRLNSKCYNAMLQTLAAGGKSEEFWGVVNTMKKKRYWVEKGTFLNALEQFAEKNMEGDVASLKELYIHKKHKNLISRKCVEICRILRSEEDEEVLFTKLNELHIPMSSDIVFAVLERGALQPKQAKAIFRWADESSSVDMDGRIYNVMARIIAQEDCIEELQDVLKKIEEKGFVLERQTYSKAVNRFLLKGIFDDAVKLFTFAMHGKEKPGDTDFLFLIKNIVAGKPGIDTDLILVTKAVRAFVEAGNSVKQMVFGAVFKALKISGKLKECENVLRAMEEGGYVADNFTHKIAAISFCYHEPEKVYEYLNRVEESGYSLHPFVWASVAQKLYLSGYPEGAIHLFNDMLVRKGLTTNVSWLVKKMSNLKGANRGHNFLSKMVNENSVKIIQRVCERRIKEGLSIETCRLPPPVNPFVEYIAKHGSVDDLECFLNAMSTAEHPSPSSSAYLCLFKALFGEGRHEVTHELLARSPPSIRNHADVLELFYNMKQVKD